MRWIMTRSLKDKMKVLSIDRQSSIQERANELIAEEMTLQDLRLALKKTKKIWVLFCI